MSFSTDAFSRIRRIHIKTKRTVENLFAGLYRSVFKGRGLEFADVREYQPGDEIRSINWNISARMRRLYVKNFQEERELTVMLIVDVSASSRFGSSNQLKSDAMAELGAILALSAIENRDKVGLLLFSDEIELYLPPKKSTRHVLRVIRELLYFQPQHKGTNLSKALAFLGNTLKHRTVCFLLSDFITQEDFSRDALLMAKKHDLILVNIEDLYETQFPDLGLVHLKDLESGRLHLIDSSHPAVQAHFKQEGQQQQQALKQLANRIGASLISFYQQDSYIEALQRFFLKRGAKTLNLFRLLFLLCPLFLWGQQQNWQVQNKDISIQISIPAASLNFNEEFALTVLLKYPQRYQFEEEKAVAHLTQAWMPFSQWKLVNQTASTTDSNAFIEKHYTFTLRPLASGPLDLTFLDFSFRQHSSDDTIQIFTPIFKIDVQPNHWNEEIQKIQPVSPFPISPQYQLSLSTANQNRLLSENAQAAEAKRNEQVLYNHAFPWKSLALLFLAILGWFVWKPLSEMVKARWMPKPVPISPKQEALQRLENLNNQQLPAKGLYKDYYSQLVDVLRAYLDEQWHLPLYARTGAETLSALNQSSLPPQIKPAIQEIFYSADQVKFAGYKPSLKESEQIYEKTKSILIQPRIE